MSDSILKVYSRSAWDTTSFVPVVPNPNSAAATNFLARTSGLDTTHQNAYLALLNGLTTDGFFNSSGVSSLLDALYVFVTSTTTTANLNLVSSSWNLTSNGTMTLTPNVGYVSAADNSSYLDTGYTPATSGGLFSQNSAHLSVWDSAVSSSGGAIGLSAGNADDQLLPGFGGSFFWRVNNSTGTSVSNGGLSGHFLGNRSGASATQGYINGSSVGSGTDASSALLNFTTITVPSQFSASSDNLRAASFGASLSSTNVSNLYSRLATFITTIAGSIP